MADAKKSRTGLYIIVGIGILVVGAIIYFFTKGDTACDPLKNGFDKKGNPNPKCQFNNPAIIGEPSPTGTSGWVSDSTFPIKRGSWGPKVAAIQKALGLPEGKCSTCADGKFGTYTEGKLIAKTGKSEISNASDYDKIINPTTTLGGKNFSDLKKALAGGSKNISGGISYPIQGQNKNYQFDYYADNGRFIVGIIGNPGFIKKGTYYDGGKKMVVDNGPTYNGTVLSNMQNIVNLIQQ